MTAIWTTSSTNNYFVVFFYCAGLWTSAEQMSSMVIISSVCYLILCASVALLPTVGRAQRGGGTVWAKKGVAPSVLGAPLRLAPCIWPRQSRLYALCVCSDCPERKSRIYIVCFLKHMFSEAAPLA